MIFLLSIINTQRLDEYSLGSVLRNPAKEDAHFLRREGVKYCIGIEESDRGNIEGKK